jgi:hypothetical protein
LNCYDKEMKDLQEYFKSISKSVDKNGGIFKEYNFLKSHVTMKTRWCLVFQRCTNPQCDHCSNLGDTKSPFLVKQLNNQGGHFFIPKKKDADHFYCFSELFGSLQ